MLNSDKIGFLNLSPLPVLFEQAGNSRLNDVPFVVVGAIGNRGLIVATSPLAYSAGIRAGITPDSARRFVPGLKIVEERPAEYYHAAETVQEISERFVPLVDPEKLDSFTLDLTGTDRLYPNASELIGALQKSIRNEINLPSRAGLGASRLIARLASMRAGEAGDSGIREVPLGGEGDFLADYSVSVLPGVGVNIAKRLRWLGVHTVRELALIPTQTLEAAFGPKGLELCRSALGHDPRPRRRNRGPKPLKREAMLEQLFYCPRQIKNSLELLVAGLGLDMRNAGMQTRSVGIEIRYPDTPPARRRKAIPPTDLDIILHRIVSDTFESMFVRRVRLRGLVLSYGRLIPRDDQLRLEFARDFSNERRQNLETAIDKIRNRYGVNTIGPGGWWKPDEAKHEELKKRWKKAVKDDEKVKHVEDDDETRMRKASASLNKMAARDRGRQARIKLKGRGNMPYRDD